MQQLNQKRFETIVILYLLAAVSSAVTVAGLEVDAQGDHSSRSLFMKRIRRELGIPSRQQHQCNPDPRSSHLNRRALCPFEIQRDTNPHRVPDVIHRAHCLCENSPCSQQQQQPGRCVSLISPLKVAYLDPQLRYVVSTEIVHVPVACICATQQPGRHMPIHRNIVV